MHVRNNFVLHKHPTIAKPKINTLKPLPAHKSRDGMQINQGKLIPNCVTVASPSTLIGSSISALSLVNHQTKTPSPVKVTKITTLKPNFFASTIQLNCGNISIHCGQM